MISHNIQQLARPQHNKNEVTKINILKYNVITFSQGSAKNFTGFSKEMPSELTILQK